MLKKHLFFIVELALLISLNTQATLGHEDLENIKLRELLNNYTKYGGTSRKSLPTEFVISGSQNPLLEYKILDSFEEEGAWKIAFNDVRVNNYFNESSKEVEPNSNFIHWKSFQKGTREFNLLNPPSQFISQQDKNSILGIRAKFHVPGTHFVRIYPTKNIIITDKISHLALWAFGINQNLDVSIGVSLQGENIINVPLGTLNYVGWKLLSFNVEKFMHQRPYKEKYTPFQVHFIEVGIRNYQDRKIGTKQHQFGLWIDNLGYSFDASLPRPETQLFAELDWNAPVPNQTKENEENQNNSTPQDTNPNPNPKNGNES